VACHRLRALGLLKKKKEWVNLRKFAVERSGRAVPLKRLKAISMSMNSLLDSMNLFHDSSKKSLVPIS
jgi:hypothetical protein